MARNVEDLEYVLKMIIGNEILKDSEHGPNVPWNTELAGKKGLRIGVVRVNEYCAIPKCGLRALELTIDALREKGNEIIEFKIP